MAQDLGFVGKPFQLGFGGFSGERWSKVLGTTAVAKHAVRAVQLGCEAVVETGREVAAHGDKATSMVLIPIAADTVNRVNDVVTLGTWQIKGMKYGMENKNNRPAGM